MKVAIIGAGAIGSVLGGLLARAGEDVTLVARQPHVDRVNANGLVMDGALGTLTIPVKAAERLDFKPDLAIVAVKTQDIVAALQENAELLENSVVMMIQNGIQADKLASQVVDRKNILSAVLLFSATFLEPGKVTYAVAGRMAIGEPFKHEITPRVTRLSEIFSKSIPTTASSNIQGMHWTKLIINENNALPAITNLAIQEINKNSKLRKLSGLLMREAVGTLDAAGISIASLPGLPAGLLRLLVHLPWPLQGILPRMIARAMGKLPALGSTLQSIRKGEKTEIDYLNGEIVTIGEKINHPTPYNTAVVKMVHEVESTGVFLTSKEVQTRVDI